MISFNGFGCQVSASAEYRIQKKNWLQPQAITGENFHFMSISDCGVIFGR
jgi:hypothetical protein